MTQKHFPLLLLLLTALLAGGFPVLAQGDPCDSLPVNANEIVIENCLPGDAPSEWQISGDGDLSIQGFATDISVNQGETVSFKIDTTAANYRIDIYRLGWYAGDGARQVATIDDADTISQNQPDCLNDTDTGLIDCGNWAVSASWAVPANAVSGIYIARPVRLDTNGASHIVFIVRDDDGESDILFQTQDTTWQAYNQYGGNSLYVGSPVGRAYKVSYNRPFTTRRTSAEDWLFNAEFPLLRWIERNGYDVSYFTGVDSHRRGAEILEHELFISIGHDEYWSGIQRANVEAARAAGVNLAFFSGNEIFWKTRWENSIDGSNTPHRTLVTYKETHPTGIDDPSEEWTGTWRDPRNEPGADNDEGPNPENSLTGTIFYVNAYRDDPLTVPARFAPLRFWRYTTVADLLPGQTATTQPGILGYEWDESPDDDFRPAGQVLLSETIVNNVANYLQDFGSTYGPGNAIHRLSLYRHSSGALVFGAGTVQWSWGLDDEHDFGQYDAADARLQQATVNLFADMGVQPQTLQSNLTQAQQTTDATAPTSVIETPPDDADLAQGEEVDINGTATDTGGGDFPGVVGGVEVSVNGGTTWRRATLTSWDASTQTANWTFSWRPLQQGSFTIRTRAVDDSGNLETPGAGITVQVGPPAPVVCPCNVFNNPPDPESPNNNDGQPIELGMRFFSSEAGFITGVRFYKSPSNTGGNIGSLWTAEGQQLASLTFTNETASGWQEATFGAPVAITANTPYIISYYSPSGYYAITDDYFTVDEFYGSLTAPADAPGAPNGVYRYGAGGGFPDQTFAASNYWVDVVFETEVDPDTIPPTVTTTTPADGATNVAIADNITATFSEPMNAVTLTAATVELRDNTSALVPAALSYNAALRQIILNPTVNLAYATAYTVSISGGVGGAADTSGNILAADYTWSFTTADEPGPPPARAACSPPRSCRRSLAIRARLSLA